MLPAVIPARNPATNTRTIIPSLRDGGWRRPICRFRSSWSRRFIGRVLDPAALALSNARRPVTVPRPAPQQRVAGSPLLIWPNLCARWPYGSGGCAILRRYAEDNWRFAAKHFQGSPDCLSARRSISSTVASNGSSGRSRPISSRACLSLSSAGRGDGRRAKGRSVSFSSAVQALSSIRRGSASWC